MPASIAEQQNERATVSPKANIQATATAKAKPDPKAEQEKNNRAPLRYQKRSLLLLAVYLPFLIIPWILTCILAV
jgi:hypothetical protein